eukprot:237456-Pyramimonas_sp.AAC.1
MEAARPTRDDLSIFSRVATGASSNSGALKGCLASLYLWNSALPAAAVAGMATDTVRTRTDTHLDTMYSMPQHD